MWRSPKSRFDAAAALSVGRRHRQEDAVLSDLPVGADEGVVVLADGMGGHNAGDVAAHITVKEAFAALRALGPSAPDGPARAVNAANDALGYRLRQDPSLEGMGATLIAASFHGNDLRWGSVGDSVLWLLRDGVLRRLNEDHSMAPRIDLMVERGLLTPEAGRTHPDRHCLTSALIGRAVAQRDCPPDALALRRGDVVLATSDGLGVLGVEGLRKILHRARRRPAAAIVSRLLEAVDRQNDPDQDNVSVVVVRVLRDDPLPVRPDDAETEAAPDPTPEAAFEAQQANG